MAVYLAIGLVIVIGLIVVGVVSELRRRREGRSGASAGVGAFAVIDEVFYPSAHESKQILEVSEEMPAPAPTPGDPFGQKVVIELPPAES